MTLSLCSVQDQARSLIYSALENASSRLPSILLIGLPGIGKHTILEEIAAELQLDIVELRLNQPSRYVLEQLFGTRVEGPTVPEDEASGGVLGKDAPTLLHLRGLEDLEPGLLHVLARVLTRRRYSDAHGRERSIGDELWIIATVSVKAGASIGPEHWISTTFDHRITVAEPVLAEDLHLVSANIAASHAAPHEIDKNVGEFFAQQPAIPENLRSIRRWIEAACSTVVTDQPISIKALREAMIDDLQWVIAGLIYRGTPLSAQHVRRWLNQFPDELRPIGVHLIREVAGRYFVAWPLFHEGLARLISDSGISPGSAVTFCKWQAMGKSAPWIAHEIKNQARWKINEDVDLSAHESSWPAVQGLSPVFVLADDFVGSGKTLGRLCKGPHSPLMKLAARYPDARFVILVFAGYQRGIQNATQTLSRALGKRLRLLTHRTYNEEDRCFSAQSRILTTERQRRNLQQFCTYVAKHHYPGLARRFIFGFEDTGGIVVFFNTVPNNTIPLMWHDQGTWVPLFPSSGLPLE